MPLSRRRCSAFALAAIGLCGWLFRLPDTSHPLNDAAFDPEFTRGRKSTRKLNGRLFASHTTHSFDSACGFYPSFIDVRLCWRCFHQGCFCLIPAPSSTPSARLRDILRILKRPPQFLCQLDYPISAWLSGRSAIQPVSIGLYFKFIGAVLPFQGFLAPFSSSR